jgi:hypothetical protein
MPITSQRCTAISHEDLRVVARAALLRLPLRAPETRRIARMRELLEASVELSRALAAQTHMSRVHCQGSYGTGDLLAETDALCESLDAFGALVAEIASEYRGLVSDAPTLDLLPEPAQVRAVASV